MLVLSISKVILHAFTTFVLVWFAYHSIITRTIHWPLIHSYVFNILFVPYDLVRHSVQSVLRLMPCIVFLSFFRCPFLLCCHYVRITGQCEPSSWLQNRETAKHLAFLRPVVPEYISSYTHPLLVVCRKWKFKCVGMEHGLVGDFWFPWVFMPRLSLNIVDCDDNPGRLYQWKLRRTYGVAGSFDRK